MKDLKSIIPHDKSDLESVDKIIILGYPKIRPILPQLLEWIQDMNWPVAQKIAPFLASIGNDIIPEIKKILQTEDYIWQYYCLLEIVSKLDKDGILLLEEELKHLRDFPSVEEKSEDLDEIATEILDILK